MAELRLGVLGGTFDPIHVGHLVVAESFRERLALDVVLFVPAGIPPHKRAGRVVAALHRYAMVALAVAGYDRFRVSDVDLRRPGPSYSVDTLEAVAGEWPGARLFFLMGSDTFLDLPTWRAPERLAAWATVAVGRRAEEAFDPSASQARAVLAHLGLAGWRPVPPTPPEVIGPGEVALVEAVSLPVSARDLRGRLGRGASVRYLVPLAVAEYIAAHRLYQDLGGGNS